jgi:hypothetical protein
LLPTGFVTLEPPPPLLAVPTLPASLPPVAEPDEFDPPPLPPACAEIGSAKATAIIRMNSRTLDPPALMGDDSFIY